jgi:mono/diheme cytochrome c family protein
MIWSDGMRNDTLAPQVEMAERSSERHRRPSPVAHRSPFSFAFLLLLATTTAAAAPPDGERLYRDHCASCHGSSGAGDGPDAKLFANQPRDLGAGFLAGYTSDDLARRILDGRALELVFDLPALKERAKEVESLVVYMARLPGVDWGRVDEGEWVYSRRCEDCHGRYGEPRASTPPGVRRPRDLSDPAFQSAIEDEELERAVAHGREGMPALVPRLEESEARQAAAYVRLLSPGHRTYSQYCANCHGEDGRGTGSFGEEIPLPTVAFDRDYFRRGNGERVRVKAWHMLDRHKPSMPHFEEQLSHAEARSIVEYLRRLEASRSRAPSISSSRR